VFSELVSVQDTYNDILIFSNNPYLWRPWPSLSFTSLDLACRELLLLALVVMELRLNFVQSFISLFVLHYVLAPFSFRRLWLVSVLLLWCHLLLTFILFVIVLFASIFLCMVFFVVVIFRNLRHKNFLFIWTCLRLCRYVVDYLSFGYIIRWIELCLNQTLKVRPM
jgi:hypothetical protein